MISSKFDPISPTFIKDAQAHIEALQCAAVADRTTLAEVVCTFSIVAQERLQRVASISWRQPLPKPLSFRTMLDFNQERIAIEDLTFWDERMRLADFISQVEAYTATCDISGYDLNGRAVILY